MSKILSALGQLITPLKNDMLPNVGGVLKNSEKNLNAHLKTKSCLKNEKRCPRADNILDTVGTPVQRLILVAGSPKV